MSDPGAPKGLALSAGRPGKTSIAGCFCLVGRGYVAFRPPGLELKRHHQSTLRSRAIASVDLKPPKRVGGRVRGRVGEQSGESG